MFISVRGRVLLNAEALNMTESVGNYVKHRRVPVMVRKGDEYVTLYVPAISGESIAHGYQAILAEEASKDGLNVCKLCSKGVFLKSNNRDTVKFAHEFDPNDLKELKEKEFEFEKRIIKGCVVEDVGGFLYAPRGGKGDVKQVKRTSNFYVGYMVPVEEALTNTVIEAQLHNRYALGTHFVKRVGEDRGQMIYYVELASAPYVFSFDLDTKYIGRTNFDTEHAGEYAVPKEERVKRIQASIKALTKLIMELGFGAKKTRYLPTIEWDSLVIAVSDDVWTVPSPFTTTYIQSAKKKAEVVSENTALHTYEKGGEKSLEEVLKEAEADALRRTAREA